MAAGRTGDIPVGSYNSSSLANLGVGHSAIDAGGGYTYFNPRTGHESAVAGLTYNSTCGLRANRAKLPEFGLELLTDCTYRYRLYQ